LCVKELSVHQAQKEYDFAQELSLTSHSNIVNYQLVNFNLLESRWYQLGSYDHYSQFILNHKVPNPISLITHFRDLVSGLSHIELKKFVHLDLKPANILVGDPEERNIPTLLIGDFGTMVKVGTLIDDDQEGDGKYIAPEVFEPDYKASTKFDVFSLALCVIEIATAEPMNNSKWNEFRNWEEEKREIKKIPNLSNDIFSLIPKMLSRNPLKRPNASDIFPLVQCNLNHLAEQLPHKKPKLSFTMKELLDETSQMSGTR